MIIIIIINNYYEDLGFDPDDDEFSRCKYIIIEVNKKIVEEKYDYQDSFYQEYIKG